MKLKILTGIYNKRIEKKIQLTKEKIERDKARKHVNNYLFEKYSYIKRIKRITVVYETSFL